MSANKKKQHKAGKEVVEKFLPPEMDNLTLDENILFDLALKNDFKTICGSIDAGTHPLSAYVIEQNLLNKRNQYGKTAFDLASSLGHKDFIRTLIERMGEKPDDITQPFNIKQMIRLSNPYNFLHYACIWGRLDLCKLLIENTKLVTDPASEESDFVSKSSETFRSAKTTNANINANPQAGIQKTLSAVLLRSKCKTGETPIQLAKRYNHEELVEYLRFGEKRQMLYDIVIDIKQFSNDPERNMNKLSKDDKVKNKFVYFDVRKIFSIFIKFRKNLIVYVAKQTNGSKGIKKMQT